MTRRSLAMLGLFGELAALVAVTVGLFPALHTVELALFDIDQSAGPDPGVNLTEVDGHPSVLYGHEVTVSARVDRIVNDQVMVIGNHAPLVSSTIVVVSGQPLSAVAGTSIDSDDAVRVTGEVLPFDQRYLRETLGIEPEGEWVDNFQEEAMFVATQVEVNPLWAYGPGDKEFVGGSSSYEIDASTDDILANPEQYLGQQVTVSAEIEALIQPPNILQIDDDRLLVVVPAPETQLVPEATLIVTGVVRRFDPDTLQSEFGIEPSDLQLAKLSGKPVIIAERMRMVK